MTQTATNLKIAMSGANVFIPDEAQHLCGVLIRTKIWNTGSPSAIVAWSLRVITATQESAECAALAMPARLDLKGDPAVSFSAADSLMIRTETTPVGPIPVIGQLLFYLELTKAAIIAPDTRLVLTVTDIYGKQTVATQLVADWLRRQPPINRG